MRRKLAYILLGAAIVVGTAATIGPSIVRMDTDIEYGYGRDLYFSLSTKDTTTTGINNEDYITNDNYEAVNLVGEEFASRLENWGINASVTKIGYSTLKVTVRAQSDDDSEYSYIANYLSFSGGNFSVRAGSNNSTVESEAPLTDNLANNNLFRNNTAEITYVNNIPVVTIEVNSTGKDGDLGKLIDYCQENTKEADSSAGTEEENCYLTIWNNWQEGDNFASATDSSSEDYDINMSKRLIFGESAANAWYDDSNDDNDYTKLQLVPNSSAITNGQYDESKAGAAYKAALYYCSLLNSSEYDYDVNLAYYTDIEPITENLINLGSWHMTPAFNASLISSLVAFAIGIIILALFFRLGTLAIVSNVCLSLLFSILLFAYFGAQFGIGALIGLFVGALICSFAGIFYFSKFKEEIYAGRSAKKAHSEAIKKALWPTLDLNIISIVVGISIYGLVPSVIGKMGLMIVFMSFFSLVFNILLLRLQGWLLANDNQTDEKIDKIYGVDKNKIPNLLNEEKQTYFGAFEKTNFKKHSKVVAIFGATLVLASVVGISIFAGINGQIYNYSSTYEDRTSISLEYRVENGSNTNLLLASKEDVESDFLPLISLDDKAFINDANNSLYNDIVFEQSTIYLTDEKKTFDVYYFEITLNRYFADDTSSTNYNFKVQSGTEVISCTTLNEALELAANSFAGSSLLAKANNVVVEDGIPSLGIVYLALGVGIISTFVYMMLRFKLSRALVSNLIALSSGLIVAGFFSLTRIASTPIVSIGIITSTLFAYFIALYMFSKEKDIYHESRERNKLTLEFKDSCLEKANNQSADSIFIFSFIVCFGVITYFGFGPSAYSTTFLGILIGYLILLVFSMCLLVPFIEYCEKLVAKINISLRPSKKNNITQKKKTSEPEEAIFIGIND